MSDAVKTDDLHVIVMLVLLGTNFVFSILLNDGVLFISVLRVYLL